MIYNLFPTPVSQTTLDFDNKKILGIVDNLPHIRYNSDNSTTAAISHELLNFEELKDLKTSILSEAKKFIFDDIGFCPGIDLYIASSWFNIHHRGDFSREHTHPNSFYSGVYYVDLPEGDSGDFYFMKMHDTACTATISPDVMYPNNYNSLRVVMDTKPGTLLMFPSHVWHGVTNNNTDHRRVTIAFNIFVRGLVSGLSTKYLELR